MTTIGAHRRLLASDVPLRFAVPLSVIAAVLAGMLVAVSQTLVVLPMALLPALLLVSSSRARIVFLVFGGLLVFQSSGELTPQKLMFFMGVAVAVVAALERSRRFVDDPAYRDLSPLFGASRALIVLMAISLPVAVAHGASETAWLRDVAPYALLASAPLFALDAFAGFSEQGLRRLLIVAGLAGSIAFTVRWLAQRDIVALGGVFGLPTLLLGAALFAYAMAHVLEGNERRLRWLVVATVVLAGPLATGTRSSVVMLAAPVAIVFGSRERFARRSVRLVVVLPAVAILVVLGVQSFLHTVNANRDELRGRIALVLHTGGQSDRSFLDRKSQTSAAWDGFKGSPILGVGPGNPIEWQDSFGVVSESPTVDSPIAYLTKFGVIGLVPLFVLAWGTVRVLRNLRRRTGERTIPQLALIGFGAVVAAWAVLQVPFEDKGLASGFLLLLALALSDASWRSTGS